ncbi:hypothetical protein A3A54_02280 [Candidatus Curtissbacteria bacterium RIFCSPLOWO2_01_FULL_39_62]|uniref:Uncharacterized protein n=2 Tax=Candidatus Curtissiibacteriota TaxID=1752717 RepID=A0A1F5G8T8_9BACT|nr:MAG: hypothetical protein A3D04_00655 [Candidatus Curtissbacteria bacterium RIFCSPHIGHO2_02_FULL_40_16b]OGE00578.1 MAG: hypothetical protein A3A54_02280 [Candidatus Curtissbacteria bacterium RIFCSPLOWO2_01_FULL_39_62]OGE12363.1 MAG: hypothetical protein A3G14_02360 [Candidatus Curtissbacteria bacterium RIFCSPLOWO2_12_FULL_38_9]
MVESIDPKSADLDTEQQIADMENEGGPSPDVNIAASDLSAREIGFPNKDSENDWTRIVEDNPYQPD